MTHIRKMVAGSVFIAFGMALPVAFHFLGLAGEMFLPMHIPVLIAGLFLGGKTGLIVGVLTPLLSSAMTGMPPLLPNVPRMAAELGAYGLTGGFFYKARKNHILASLLAAMILGRLAALVMGYILVMFLGLGVDPVLYAGASMLKGIPGIIVQFIFIPYIVKKLESTGIAAFSINYGATENNLTYNFYANTFGRDAFLRNNDYDADQFGFVLKYKFNDNDSLKFSLDRMKEKRGRILQNSPGGPFGYDPSYPLGLTGEGFAPGSYWERTAKNYAATWHKSLNSGFFDLTYWKNDEKLRSFEYNAAGDLAIDKVTPSDHQADGCLPDNIRCRTDIHTAMA